MSVHTPGRCRGHGVTEWILLSVAVVFALGSRLGRHLTSTARVIMTRVMGLILASIAVQMIVEGLATLLPGLGAAAGAG